jgi:hypothetical protein
MIPPFFLSFLLHFCDYLPFGEDPALYLKIEIGQLVLGKIFKNLYSFAIISPWRWMLCFI